MKKKTSKILIVEDEVILNDAYKTILEKEGYDTYCAFNGEEAIKITKDIEPDLILLDLRMPKMSGIEFLKKYKLKTDHPNVKVIIFSNLDAEKEVDEAFSLGAQKYMLKAWVSPKELNKLVKEVLAP